jgi:FtsH-binding integral membrane protein
VAFVPTNSPAQSCGVLGSVTKWVPAITNNVISLMLALTVAGAVLWIVYWRTHAQRQRSLGGWLALVALWAVVALGVVEFTWNRAYFDDNAHDAAAITMFVAIIITVCISAAFARHQTSPHTKLYFWLYLGVATAMVVSLVAVGAYRITHSQWGHWVIVIEALLIAEFAAYWTIQTVELWNVKTRKELLPDDLRAAADHTVDPATPGGFGKELRELRNQPAANRLMRAL